MTMLLELLIAGHLQTYNPQPEPEVKEEPQIIEIVKEEKPKPKKKELTLQQKIDRNHYKCDESTQYIRADNAQCLDKPVIARNIKNPVRTTVYASEANLVGSIGRVSPFGNCVDEPGVNRGMGNPSNWSVLTVTPSIGATALWHYNHTGIVTGIWSNGDIEVRHQNFNGDRTRFSPSEFRGFR